MSCVSARSLDKSLYAFLHNEKKQMDASKVLKEVGERGANSSKVFQEDLILLDLTEDLKEGTTQSLDHLKKLFGLRALEDYSGYGDVSCGESHGEAVMDMLMHWKRWRAVVDATKSEQRDAGEVFHYEKAAIGGHPTARHNLANHEGRNI